MLLAGWVSLVWRIGRLRRRIGRPARASAGSAGPPVRFAIDKSTEKHAI